MVEAEAGIPLAAVEQVAVADGGFAERSAGTIVDRRVTEVGIRVVLDERAGLETLWFGTKLANRRQLRN